MNYPSIPCLFDRYPKGHPLQFAVDCSSFSQPEFHQIDYWLVTEKVDGMNVNVSYHKSLLSGEAPTILFQGRTEKSDIPKELKERFLDKVFTIEKVENALFFRNGLPQHASFFLEGYGPGIQKRGEKYRHDQSAVLFDVWVDGIWLNFSSVRNIAEKLGIWTVPELGTHTLKGAILMAERGIQSIVATFDEDRIMYPNVSAEGIVARTEPLLLNRKGERIIWKLKTRDFSPSTRSPD